MFEPHGTMTDDRSRGGPISGDRHAFVVPAYGCSPFLDACLASLMRQTVRSSVVVVTSTPSGFIDETARRHGLPVVPNPIRDGIASDWNFALQAVDARYVTLAHQDDIYAATFLERTLDAFARYDGTLCFTGYQEIDDAGQAVSSRISRVKHGLTAATIGVHRRPSRLRLRAFLSLGNPLPCSSVTFDRQRLPDFAFSPLYASNLDWDAWWRLLEQGERFLSVPDRLVGRRHNALTATAALIADGRRRSEDLTMFRRIWPRPIGDALAVLYRAGY